MPEGDTIFRTARALHAALAGRVVTAFGSTVALVDARAGDLVGRLIEGVGSRGKHLLLSFEGELVLHTHQGLHGGWSLERVPRSARQFARVFVQTAEAVAVCRRSPVVELIARRALARHPVLSRLGPDLLAPGLDSRDGAARLRARPDAEIGVAIMDQSLLAGVGNVYKSEALFLCGIAPDLRISAIDSASLERLVATAARLLQRNLGPGPRRTTAGLSPQALHVYGRAGQPCLRCGSEIRRVVQGAQARSTYYCPRCQAKP